MHWTFATFGSPQFIRITLSGSFDGAQFAAMLSELAAKDYFEKGSRLLFDDRALELAGMTDNQLLEASNAFIKENPSLAYAKVAIVTTPEEFQVGRMFEKITEQGSRAVMQIFDSEREALVWLVGTAAEHIRAAWPSPDFAFD